jgi:mannosyl-oligosaccharide glucosidase
MQLLFLALLSYIVLPIANAQSHGIANHSTSDAQSMLWGPYRPNLYFGLRPRIPRSLMTGLMWFGTQSYHATTKIRHACDQADKLDAYTWTEFDIWKGGVQVIKDGANNVEITTEFLKIPGGRHGGSWAARIKGRPIDQCASIVF